MLTQEFVNISQPPPGHDAFYAHAMRLFKFFHEILQQLELEGISWCKIRMPAFTRKCCVVLPGRRGAHNMRGEKAFAETSAWPDASDGRTEDSATALQLQSASGVMMHETRDLSYTLIGINTTRPPFDNPVVRRALNMAVDRDQIIAAALYVISFLRIVLYCQAGGCHIVFSFSRRLVSLIIISWLFNFRFSLRRHCNFSCLCLLIATAKRASALLKDAIVCACG